MSPSKEEITQNSFSDKKTNDTENQKSNLFFLIKIFLIVALIGSDEITSDKSEIKPCQKGRKAFIFYKPKHGESTKRTNVRKTLLNSRNGRLKPTHKISA